MIGVDTKGIIRKLFNSLLNRYQAVLEQSMIGSDFAFDYVKIIFLRKPWWKTEMEKSYFPQIQM